VRRREFQEGDESHESPTLDGAVGHHEGELIFDIGKNNGDDTAHYLSNGYRVVTVEADPRSLQ
jgi:hypothetical protein